MRAGMPLVPKAPSCRRSRTDRAAQATAAVSSTASAVAGAAVAAVAEATAPPPPPRERWTFSLCGSCAEQPGFASYACVAPCFATGPSGDQQLPLKFGQSGGQGGCVFAHVQPGRLLALRRRADVVRARARAREDQYGPGRMLQRRLRSCAGRCVCWAWGTRASQPCSAGAVPPHR